MQAIVSLSSLLLLAAFSCLPLRDQDPNEIWAVLVAGSNSYWNYRHQSDLSASYQLLIQRGVPRDQIITLMYDDVANDSSNPYPGQLFNWPGGPDVYEGVRVDYRQEDVTWANLKAVMLGEAGQVNGKGSGRVLKSDSTKHLFFYFVDNGGYQLLELPNEELVTSQDFTDLFSEMIEKRMFQSAVVFIEACESGSMIEGWEKFGNKVFAATASGSLEPSYATFCEDLKLDTCMADEFSYNWMVTARMLSPSASLDGLASLARAKTKRSSVQELGADSMKRAQNGLYLGDVDNVLTPDWSTYQSYKEQDTHPTWRLPLIHLKKKAASGELEHVERLKSFEQKLDKLDEKIIQLKDLLKIPTSFELEHNNFDKDCYGEAVRQLVKKCAEPELDSFILRHVRLIASACGVYDLTRVQKAITNVCA